VSGIIGIDIDGDLEKVKKQYDWLFLPKTICFKTHRGFRFIYEYNEHCSASKSYKSPEGGIDILSNGKQTIMPPSKHELGTVYRWCSECSTLAKCPNLQLPKTIYNRNENTPKSGVQKTFIPEGERNSRLFKAACGARRHGAEQQDLLELVKSMNKRCEPPLEESVLYTISSSASKYKVSW